MGGKHRAIIRDNTGRLYLVKSNLVSDISFEKTRCYRPFLLASHYVIHVDSSGKSCNLTHLKQD